MRVKDEVMELLRQGDSEGLERLVGETPAAVRFLQGRLWDTDPEIRSEAAVALGAAAAAHPDLGRELLRQALWALNDESATNGAYVLPAIGEIGRRAPELAAPFVGPMTGYLWDDGLRHGILEALCRMNETAPELIDDVRDRLLAVGETDDTGEQECLDTLLAVDRESADGE
jgi:hypothetical protein